MISKTDEPIIQFMIPSRSLFTHLLLLALPVSAMAVEWQTLFDGKDLSAWKTPQKPADVPVDWAIEDGVLAWRKDCGNLVTREKFADFELELQWKISEGGNSGVMFRVDEALEKPWHTGPEVQVLDNAKHKDGRNPVTSAGSIYALYAPSQAAARPVGEWNRLRMRVKGPRITVWLNDVQVNDAATDSEDWKTRVTKSKFAPFPQFGRTTTGYILLQDHSNPVWFRDIRIRRL